MTTTVRITEEDRDRLDRLLRRRRALRQERVTLQQLLHEAIGLAERRFDELPGAWRPFTAAEFEALEKSIARHGWDGDHDDIDEVVYSRRQIFGEE